MSTTEGDKARTEHRHRRGVRLVPEGLDIGGELVPLLAGSVHYWRLDPTEWRACLTATKALGVRLIDVYVPWNVHEVSPGRLELGQTDPQRDIAAFLRLCQELGLYAIFRPGPHINAELTYFGIPERIIWDPACQARSPGGNPVLLPMVPFGFPVPSYASEAFLDEATRYFHLLAPAITPLLYPEGPIVLVQIDNEGALYFRDGAYDQDYHPDAVRLYRAFLRDKYRTLDALQAAYARKPSKAEGQADDGAPATDTSFTMSTTVDEEKRFATLLPPTRFDAETTADLARHLDWADFHEHLLAHAFDRFGAALAAAGIDGLPTTHNLPMGQDATPLNAARVGRAVDLVGLDYYAPASEESRRIISRRTSELAVRCEGLGHPPFACEIGAGFPPFFPPFDERDNAFTLLAALAYGLRGYNLYMAVERDRWIGAPIDRHGRARPFAAFFQKLARALDHTSFFSLRRSAPVRIVTPRSERRLARVMHAFGPITGAFFSVLGKGAREGVSEQDLGLGYPLGIEADSFVRTFEQALEARGVPFAHVGGEDRDVSLEGARWIVCASAGGLNPGLFARLEREAQAGARVTLGPRAPAFDGAVRPLAEPLDPARLRRPGDVPALLRRAGDTVNTVDVLVADDPALADAAVSRAVLDLGLPTFACDPDGIFCTVHEDREGRPKVVFVINPGSHDLVAKVGIGVGDARAVDLLDETAVDVKRGAFEVRMKPHTVRMLALSPSS
ncbi:MAG: beta-galactosidase [Byssovorax sp.]